MKGIIFCAGLGTRLRPLTNNIPKPMIEVAGKPVLEHLVEKLNKFGVKDIIVNTHYYPEKIYKYFGTKLIYSYEPTLLGEHGTMIKLLPWLSDQFVAMNGDTLSDLDLKKMYASAIESESSKVSFINKDDKEERDGGTWFYKKGYFKQALTEFDYISEAKWFDIGTPAGLEEAKKYYEELI